MRLLLWLAISACAGIAALLLLRVGVTTNFTRAAPMRAAGSTATTASNRTAYETNSMAEQTTPLEPGPGLVRSVTEGSSPALVPPLPPQFVSFPPETILEGLRTTLRLYNSSLGENPVGDNREITAALNGGNARQIVFLQEDGNRINSRGELVDIWGTPYFFHQLSGQEMEIRSAGPDKAMWNDDDLVTR